MNVFRLVLKEYSENILKCFILALVSMVVTITCMFWFVQRDIVYGAVDNFKAYGLSDKVLVFANVFSSNDSLQSELESIKKLDSVGNADYCYYKADAFNFLDTRIPVPNEGCYNVINLKKIPVLKSNPYKMIAGRMPEKENEIAISSNVKYLTPERVRYSVGDKLYNMQSYVEFGKAAKAATIPEVTIVGIFDIENLLPLSQTSFSEETSGEGSLEGYEWTDEMYGYAFFIDIKDSEGNSIKYPFSSLSNPTEFIIEPAEGYTTNDVVRELGSDLGITGYDLKGYIKYTEEYHEEELMGYRALSISIIVILLTVNVSYCLINMSIRRREMSLYYVHGYPWHRVVGLNSYMYLIYVVIGYAIGVGIYKFNKGIFSIVMNGQYLFSETRALMIGCMIIGSYLSVNLIFYLYTRRKTPIDLLRRE